MQQPPGRAHVEPVGPHDSRLDAGQLATKAIDGPGAVADKIGAAAREQTVLGDRFVAWPGRLQIAAQAAT
ncbi:hypothetical protein GCM10017778_30230 [Streptomyces vinaceus]|nr:hypothetical protein GCM10017778_30230 [Streptomyces vinaceus]